MMWLAVGVGGALGSMARHGVNLLFARLLERVVPYATAAVNLSGAAAIGILAGLIAGGRLHLSLEVRTLIFVGILGGFTTFSSYMLDTLTLAGGGEPALAIGNVAVQTTAGFAAVWGGYRLALLFVQP
jgi:fluoride exporter